MEATVPDTALNWKHINMFQLVGKPLLGSKETGSKQDHHGQHNSVSFTKLAIYRPRREGADEIYIRGEGEGKKGSFAENPAKSVWEEK